MTIKALSLFACSGIGELGLEQNGIEFVVANELLKDRCDFYSYNHPLVNMINGSITNTNVKNEIVQSSIRMGVEYIQATPPCQGFSKAGKMIEDDPRNHLIIDAIEVISQINPKWILIENVPQFLTNNILVNGTKINTIKYIEVKLSDYNIIYKILNVADYGIAQQRKRGIILLSRKDVVQLQFPIAHAKIITVKEAIGHLPSLESGQTSKVQYHNAKKHNSNHISWMRHTPSGQTAFNNKTYFPQKDGRVIRGFKTTYKRIKWDEPAPTITMGNGAISSQNNVHPGIKQVDGTYSDARVLTILELMILTGIDKTWKIPSWASDNLIRKMLGESVPPCVPYEITKQLKDI